MNEEGRDGDVLKFVESQEATVVSFDDVDSIADFKSRVMALDDGTGIEGKSAGEITGAVDEAIEKGDTSLLSVVPLTFNMKSVAERLVSASIDAKKEA